MLSVWQWLLESGVIYYVVGALIALLLGRKSQVEAWAEKNPKAAGLLKILRGVGLDPWMILQGLSLLVKSRLPVSSKVENPPPSGKLPPSSGAGIATLFLLLLGCSSTPQPCTPADTVLIAHGAECRARVERECQGIPDEECPVVAECDQWGDAYAARHCPEAVQ